MTLFNKIKNLILDILFPPLCANCQNHLENRNKFVCDGCFSSIKLNNTLFCPVCQARLPENRRICRHDREKTEKFPYLLGAATNYQDKIVQNLIHYYKYKSFDGLSSPLGEILVKYLDSIIRNCPPAGGLEIRNFILVPVPLHFFRERKRGFNQAKLLAQIISKKFDLEMIGPLIRVKNNPPQARLAKSDPIQARLDKKQNKPNDRWENISNAFKIIDPEKIKNKNIILIDDVYTSGATMSEAARALKSAGADKIIALVLAKA